MGHNPRNAHFPAGLRLRYRCPTITTTLQMTSTPPQRPFLLAIEVITRGGSIAWTRPDHSLASHRLPADTSAAAGLGIALDEVMARDDFQSPDLVAVADGPGSFTGLRIAVTSAKTLAYAFGKPVVVVDSMAAMAATLALDKADPSLHLRVGLSAYRGQVFAAQMHLNRSLSTWNHHARNAPPPDGTSLMTRERWHAWLDDGAAPFLATGDRSVFNDVDPSRFEWMASSDPVALGVAKLAQCEMDRGQVVDAMQVLPRYFRPSAAEETSRRHRS